MERDTNGVTYRMRMFNRSLPYLQTIYPTAAFKPGERSIGIPAQLSANNAIAGNVCLFPAALITTERLTGVINCHLVANANFSGLKVS